MRIKSGKVDQGEEANPAKRRKMRREIILRGISGGKRDKTLKTKAANTRNESERDNVVISDEMYDY